VTVRCAVVAAALSIAIGVSACGDDQDGPDSVLHPTPAVGEGLPPEIQHPVTTAINRIQSAFARQDYASLCEWVTPPAARAAGEAAHGTATTCKRDMDELLELIRYDGGWHHAGQPRVVDVAVDGTHATATIALDRHWRARVSLARHDGRWKLNGFFGAPAAEARKAVEAVPNSPFPPPGSPAVTVSSQGQPCPPLANTDYRTIEGGCLIEFRSRVVPLKFLTPLGDFVLDDCSIGYDIRVDADGRTWSNDLTMIDGPGSKACTDVKPCYADDGPVAWRGRLEKSSDGAFVHRTRMCMTTCVGHFVGDFVVRLSRTDNGWRAEPVDGGGTTGFRLDYPLRVNGQLDISPAARALALRQSPGPRRPSPSRTDWSP
jgi:hypothetical protein